MRQISVTYRCAMRFREDALADTGLAGCQTPYLTALYRHPGLSQEEMARQLNVNKSSVARQLALLEDKGYIRREPSSTDKRLLLVYPTEKALDVKDRLYRCYHDWNSYLTEGFTEEERQTLSDLMARVSERAVEYIENGGGKLE
jgi:DNA-binding MarR family transcriptional regulator